MSLWRVNKKGQDVLIQRFTVDGPAWKVYEKFSRHLAALSGKRTYYLRDVGTPFSGSEPQSVRDRPGMYIGDTSEYGIAHLIPEVISNSADQFLQGEATGIRVQLSGRCFEVEDDGAGSQGRKNCYNTNSQRFGYNYDGEALSFSIACIGESDKETEVHSWVNGGRTSGHGTHVDGALEALEMVHWRPAVVTLSVVMKEAQYAGPTKDRLGAEKVKSIIRDALEPHLREFDTR